jgi:hypothetical protein
MMNFSRNLLIPASLGLALAALALPVKADLIELTNGDHYRGTVIGMTATNIDFLSEIQGRVKLPRDKVAQITLHEVTPKAIAAQPATTTTVPPLILSGPTSAPPAAPASSQADAVVQQMRQQGVDPKLVNQVQEQIFGKASPEAAQKFDQMMSGLMSGSVSMNDLRAQAQSSINQIKAAKKELGDDDGGMLDSYLAILQKFMNESATDTTVPVPQAAPNPAPGGTTAPSTPVARN